MREPNLASYEHIGRPFEDEEIKWWRQWLVEIIYGLWNEKNKALSEVGFPSRPIRQQEIYREVTRRVFMLKGEGLWNHKEHGHNWVERRVNELVTEEFGPKNEHGILKVVRIAGDNLYEPNPKLFSEEK